MDKCTGPSSVRLCVGELTVRLILFYLDKNIIKAKSFENGQQCFKYSMSCLVTAFNCTLRW